MEHQQALSLLGLETGANKAAIEKAYETKKAAVAKKMESAPTDALKQKYVGLQKQLDEASSIPLAATD